MAKAGLSEEVTFELGPEETGECSRRTLLLCKSPEASTYGISSEEQEKCVCVEQREHRKDNGI